MKITRREFIAGAAVGAAGGTLISRTPRASAAAEIGAGNLPRPESSGIDHIVVVMMENRSFDHFLGWLPGADGRQAGLVYQDKAGVAHSTYRLSMYQGCGYADPDHSWEGGRTEYANGACDGWLLAGDNDEFAI